MMAPLLNCTVAVSCSVAPVNSDVSGAPMVKLRIVGGQCCNFEVAAQEMHDADVFRQIVIWNSLAMKWSWRTI
jgi:hypothetical protein